MARAKKPLPPVFDKVVSPVRAFLALEAASGILLFVAALIALGWANSPWSASYFALFAAPITIGVGAASTTFDVLHFVNDGLMTLFFFVVGMHIKQELVHGELRTRKAAILPAAAALGGMIVPAGIYIAFTYDGPGRAGWGIPMATDIAFCAGCMTLLGKRVPHGLVVFLTALAIFDDIGGILVIAFFYGEGVHFEWLGIAALVTVGLFVLNRLYVISGLAWLIGGVSLWYALHHGGIHATIAGVVLGLMVPAHTLQSPRAVLQALHDHVGRILGAQGDQPVESEEILAIEERLEDLEPPLDRFVHLLHGWVGFVVMPVFAFANSGVSLATMDRSDFTSDVALGTALGLFVGKQVGIYATTLMAAKAVRAPLPGGSTKPKVWGTALIAGIGFTVALFIAALAFPNDARLLDQAKLGILAGSFASGVVGYVVLRMTRIAPT